MRLRLLGLLVILPACGSILGVEALDAPADTATDAGTKDSATTSSSSSGGSSTSSTGGPSDAGDGGPPSAALPPFGTYDYGVTGTGHDVIAFDNIQIADNPYTAPSITIAPDPAKANCFIETVALRTNYTDTLSTYCVNGPNVTLQEDVRAQVFTNGVNANTTSHCTGLDPDADAAAAPGDLYFTTQPQPNEGWLHTCLGSNTANDSAKSSSSDGSQFVQTGDYNYLETIPVNVGGSSIPTYHFKVHLVISGAQTGTNDTEIYMSTKYALPVRFVRNIHISYGVYGGTATYDEAVDMTLKSPPP